MSEYMQVWGLRKQQLEAMLGKAEDEVLTAIPPIYLGGFADVMRFCGYVPGCTYVTGGLTGLGGQRTSAGGSGLMARIRRLMGGTAPNPDNLGQYELMICASEPSEWAGNIISRLARYTHDAILKWNDTMDIGSAVPQPSAIKAFLFAEPQPPAKRFTLECKPCHLVLCVGITASELAFKMKHGAPALVEKLKAAGVFPYTNLQRGSAV